VGISLGRSAVFAKIAEIAKIKKRYAVVCQPELQGFATLVGLLRGSACSALMHFSGLKEVGIG
jgi:hypothetical protein